ncbi:MAG: DUF4252 domain-containing protein [Candidatus Latescibacterota bacterium]
MRFHLCVCALVVGLGRAWAAESVEGLPGYVDFGALSMPRDAHSSIEVFLKGPVLKLVAAASRQEDPEVAALIDRIRLIRVQGFSVRPGDRAAVQEEMAALARRLEEKEWERVAQVREEDEVTQVLVKVAGDGDALCGLVVMSLEEGEEAVFVNIVGDLDPEQLGRIGRTFDIAPLDSLRLGRQAH